MLGLGLASSHAPGMWRPAAEWPKTLERQSPEARSHLPHSARVEMQSPELIESYIKRFQAAFATLRQQVQAYQPDALLMIGDDQGDMFDVVNNPTFAIYTGQEPIWGVSVHDPMGTPPDQRTKITFPNHSELATYILQGLVKKGFDMANIGKFAPRGNPQRGVSHMVSNLVPEVDPQHQIPLVCLFMNEYFPPLPTAERCAQLGAALTEILAERPERVAIYASGGLSHFPGEFNAGWIDPALDHWILERLECNDLEALKHLFTFDSINLRSGTGEVRAWISVAAAMHRPAKVVEYVPAHGTLTGCGFVYWPAVESPVVERAAARATAGRALR